MKATVVDLRYRMKEVLEALQRNEDVAVLHRGRVRGVLRPHRSSSERCVREHPFFGLRPGIGSVEDVMDELRGGRRDAL